MTSRSAPKPAAARLRCAIYTRKSSEEGLDQSFNSLDAQREACEAYVMSQVGEGWTALPARYDDGGFSGGNMERPGLKKLLADIGRGAVDIVVVYKVDRLTRSLADFARIVDAFDGKGVSFVSVTQAFNTTTSMGRLTLNVLLSFAQFEREVTGERIRDKIAASKKKGMWMGGTPPLGYRPDGRTLKVDEAEAGRVRHIFERYLALRSVHQLRDELAERGIRGRPGKRSVEGAEFTRGALYHLLSNRLYVGEIVHKDMTYPGQHPAIVERENFDEVAALLAANRSERKDRVVTVSRAPLTGLIFDSRRRPMSPVSTRNRSGQVYRYYVSAPLLGGKRKAGDDTVRISAPEIERLVLEHLGKGETSPDWEVIRPRIAQIEINPDEAVIVLKPEEEGQSGRRAGGRLSGNLEIELLVPLENRPWRGETIIRRPAAGRKPGEVDQSLVRALARAHDLVRTVRQPPFPSLETLAPGHADDSYIRRLARLAFLAPELQKAIVEGRQPPDCKLERLMRADLPLSWLCQQSGLDDAGQRPRQ